MPYVRVFLSMRICAATLGIVFAALLACVERTDAAEKTIYHFKGLLDGFGPNGLISDRAGNLFGTTRYGGDLKTCFQQGCGTLFELTPPSVRDAKWTKTTIHVFVNNNTDGYWPSEKLLIDKAGNLFGVTEYGGVNRGGLVFEFSPPAVSGGQWTESYLFSFLYGYNGKTGYGPFALIFDRGTLYGTTFAGGTFDGGTVFKLQPPMVQGGMWRESVLHNFPEIHGTGSSPGRALAVDRDGNLYGTRNGDYTRCTYNNLTDCGAVFRLTRALNPSEVWDYDVLHRFTGFGDGFFPNAGLTLDGAGDIFGTTEYGAGGGTVFELTPPAHRGGTWSEYILDSFLNYSMDGDTPLGPVTLDSLGNLFGTTSAGGAFNAGTVFKLQPPGQPGGNWTETVLFNFPGGAAGSSPDGPVIFSIGGKLYGTAASGGFGCKKYGLSGCGDVFSLTR